MNFPVYYQRGSIMFIGEAPPNHKPRVSLPPATSFTDIRQRVTGLRVVVSAHVFKYLRSHDPQVNLSTLWYLKILRSQLRALSVQIITDGVFPIPLAYIYCGD